MKTCDTETIEQYIDIFMELLPSMIKKQEGKWTVIGKDKKPIGFFETNSEALCAGVEGYGKVSMLVRQVSKEYLEYGRYGIPEVYHSRVSFK